MIVIIFPREKFFLSESRLSSFLRSFLFSSSFFFSQTQKHFTYRYQSMFHCETIRYVKICVFCRTIRYNAVSDLTGNKRKREHTSDSNGWFRSIVVDTVQHSTRYSSDSKLRKECMCIRLIRSLLLNAS